MARRRGEEEEDQLPTVTRSASESRVLMAEWFKEQLAVIERDTADRIERLRAVGEHPSPLFSRLVQHHAAMGLDAKVIAKMLQIPYSTLALHYADELEIGVGSVTLRIAENMARKALSVDDKDAAKVGMAWLERRGGDNWRTTKKVEIDDKRNQTPILDSSKLSPEERQKLREVIEAAIRSGEQIQNDVDVGAADSDEVLNAGLIESDDQDDDHDEGEAVPA
jgi:hypothetical protein